VGVPSSGAGPLRIEAVAPNPAVGARSSFVSFMLPRAGRVLLEVYDVRGARVRRLLDAAHPAGRSSMAWDGKDDDGRLAGAGVYLMVLKSGDESARTKLIRLP
jgi:flagellar hook assembly protein FlgD